MEFEGYNFDYVYDNIIDKPYTFFRKQYHLLTNDHEEIYLMNNIDIILDSYRMYRDAKYPHEESLTYSMKDCLDEMLLSNNNLRGI